MDISYQDMIDRIKNELQRNDADIEDIIKHAISDAIRHFKDEVFAVNQASFYGTLSKFDETNSQYKDQTTKVIKDPLYFAMFQLPLDFSQMINLQVVKSGTNYQMEQIPYADLDHMDAKYDDPSTGTPSYYAFQGEYRGTPQSPESSPAGPALTEDTDEGGVKLGTDNYYLPGHIRVFPHPDENYTLALRYVSNLADPANLGSSTRNAAGFWMNEAGRMIKCYACLLYTSPSPRDRG